MINHDNLKTELKKNGFSFEFYKYIVNIFGILEHKALFDGISLCDTIEFYNNLGCINSEKLVIDRLKLLKYALYIIYMINLWINILINKN